MQESNVKKIGFIVLKVTGLIFVGLLLWYGISATTSIPPIPIFK